MSKIVTDFFGITTPDDEENKKQEDIENLNNEENNEENNETNNNDGSVNNLEKDSINDNSIETKEEEVESEEEEEEDDDDDDSDVDDLQKLEWGYEERNTLLNYHPEVNQISEEQLQTLSTIVKDKNGNIIDPFHKTIPIMTKYEKAKIIGIRAQQINSGSEPFIQVDNNMIDGLTIANDELLQRKIPFIIRRPLPNGTSEYWNINDLELLE
tara:strand:- start:967 stop:1602 length:636 start_codon:yes stop_codon:yes gene_type:complete